MVPRQIGESEEHHAAGCEGDGCLDEHEDRDGAAVLLTLQFDLLQHKTTLLQCTKRNNIIGVGTVKTSTYSAFPPIHASVGRYR